MSFFHLHALKGVCVGGLELADRGRLSVLALSCIEAVRCRAVTAVDSRLSDRNAFDETGERGEFSPSQNTPLRAASSPVDIT